MLQGDILFAILDITGSYRPSSEERKWDQNALS